jgi:hypothetical protein
MRLNGQKTRTKINLELSKLVPVRFQIYKKNKKTIIRHFMAELYSPVADVLRAHCPLISNYTVSYFNAEFSPTSTFFSLQYSVYHPIMVTINGKGNCRHQVK